MSQPNTTIPVSPRMKKRLARYKPGRTWDGLLSDLLESHEKVLKAKA